MSNTAKQTDPATILTTGAITLFLLAATSSIEMHALKNVWHKVKSKKLEVLAHAGPPFSF